MFRRQKYVAPTEVSLARITSRQLDENAKFTDEMKTMPPLQKLESATWFVPNFDHVLKGGLRTVFILAQRFSKQWGTKNYIVIDNFFDRGVNENLESQLRDNFPGLDFVLFNLKSCSSTDEIPPADAGFCTLWVTAYTLARYNRVKAKFYIMQDYEPQFYPSGSISAVIEHTYRLGFYFIANTPGVAQKFVQYSDWGMEFIPGVDQSIYFPIDQPVKEQGPYQIVFYGRPTNERNCFSLCIEALRLVKKEMGDQVNIVSVGAKYSSNYYRLNGVVENRGLLPTMEDVASLYRESDLGISLMTTPHPSYQPLEYMASGCPCLTNINEANNWLYRDGENVVLSPPLASVMAENIISTLNNPQLRQNLKLNGIATAKKLSWEDSLDSIVNYVVNPCRRTAL